MRACRIWLMCFINIIYMICIHIWEEQKTDSCKPHCPSERHTLWFLKVCNHDITCTSCDNRLWSRTWLWSFLSKKCSPLVNVDGCNQFSINPVFSSYPWYLIKRFHRLMAWRVPTKSSKMTRAVNMMHCCLRWTSNEMRCVSITCSCSA